jgi:hypothetical protein
MLLLSDLADVTLIRLRELCDASFLWGERLDRLLPALRTAVLAEPAALQSFGFLLRKLLQTAEHAASYVMSDAGAAEWTGDGSDTVAVRHQYLTELRLIAGIVL